MSLFDELLSRAGATPEGAGVGSQPMLDYWRDHEQHHSSCLPRRSMLSNLATFLPIWNPKAFETLGGQFFPNFFSKTDANHSQSAQFCIFFFHGRGPALASGYQLLGALHWTAVVLQQPGVHRRGPRLQLARWCATLRSRTLPSPFLKAKVCFKCGLVLKAKSINHKLFSPA